METTAAAVATTAAAVATTAAAAETTAAAAATTTPATCTSTCSDDGTDFCDTTDKITTGLTTCGGPTGNRIVGGVDADANTWPWIVSLGFQDSSMLGTSSIFHCGGTILNEQYILTAAHCCEGTVNVKINFAQHNKIQADSGEFQIESDEFVSHPSYKNPGQNFDVCIVNVKESIWDAATANGADSSKVAAACLPTAEAVHGSACWVAGWGTLVFEGGSPNILQSVGVNIFSQTYADNNSMFGQCGAQADEFCAGTPDCDNNDLTDPGKDSCQGDSGGPLTCAVDGKAVVTGIVSRGSGCADEGNSGIYGEVFDYLDWINANSVVSL